jgi:hypothetical protein
MLSIEQRLEILKKLSIILKELPNCNSIGEISKKTQIPKSTIQRYLNNKSIFIELFEEKSDFEYMKKALVAYEASQQFLFESKKSGLSKGGLKSQELHGYVKDESGKFHGGKKSS